MFKFFTAVACILLLSAVPALAAPSDSSKAAADNQDNKMLVELESFVLAYLQRYNLEIRPSKSSPMLVPRDGKVVATYIELDTTSAMTTIIPSGSKDFPFLAKLTYLEHTYEAVGDTEEDALNGVFIRIKSRRLTELPRYVRGVWHN